MVTTATADRSPAMRLKVFDFNEEDYQVETDASKIISKYEKPKSDHTPIAKYDFLQCYLPEGQAQAQGNDLSNSPVIVFPDYIRYGDVYSSESQLTFSSGFIKVEGSFSFGNKGPFNFTWATDDIISIESQWCEMVQTALVSIHFKLKVDDKATDSSDVGELKISVFDPNWSERQKAIKSLNVIYNTRWNLDLNNETDRRLDVSSDNSFVSDHYTSNDPEHVLLEQTFREDNLNEGWVYNKMELLSKQNAMLSDRMKVVEGIIVGYGNDTTKMYFEIVVVMLTTAIVLAFCAILFK